MNSPLTSSEPVKVPLDEAYLYYEDQINPSVKIHAVSRKRSLLTSTDFLFILIGISISSSIYLVRFLLPRFVIIQYSLTEVLKRLISAFWLLAWIIPALKIFRHLFSIQKESMMIIDGLGLQLMQQTYIGTKKLHFVERSKVRAIVINEAISCGNVYPYLAIITHDQAEMTLAFDKIRVKYEVLINIYNDAMETLAKS